MNLMDPSPKPDQTRKKLDKPDKPDAREDGLSDPEPDRSGSGLTLNLMNLMKPDAG